MLEKLMDIKVLAELKLDIIQNGKIRQMPKDFDGFEYPFPCLEDSNRIKGLESVMDKYNYGWYIATETLEEQLQSITKFEQYILCNATNPKPTKKISKAIQCLIDEE